jgi:hypothetical protein
MEKNFALCATKKINILTLVLSEKKFLNETKTIFQVGIVLGKKLNFRVSVLV